MPFHSVPPYILALAISGTNLFAGTAANGVFLTTNNGTSWTAVNNGLSTLGSYGALIVSGTNIFAGSTSAYSDKGVFLSTNNGTSWTVAFSGMTNGNVRALTISGTNLLAGIVATLAFIYRPIMAVAGQPSIPVSRTLVSTLLPFPVRISLQGPMAVFGGVPFLK